MNGIVTHLGALAPMKNVFPVFLYRSHFLPGTFEKPIAHSVLGAGAGGREVGIKNDL